MISTNETSHNGRQPNMALTKNQSDPIFKAESIMTDQDYNLVQTQGKSEPAVSETIAAIVRAIHSFPAKIAIGWQNSVSGMSCRYVVDVLSPRLNIDLMHQYDGKILISLSNADHWQINHDEIMPRYAFDVAYEIRSATRNSKLVIFKQPALRNAMGG